MYFEQAAENEAKEPEDGEGDETLSARGASLFKGIRFEEMVEAFRQGGTQSKRDYRRAERGYR